MLISQSVLVSFFCLAVVFLVLAALYVIIRIFTVLLNLIMGGGIHTGKNHTSLPPNR